MIFGFCAKIDNKLTDPVWETVSFKVKKYRPFINIDISKCKTILRDLSMPEDNFFSSQVVLESIKEIVSFRMKC